MAKNNQQHETELVVDKMFFAGSDSHEYQCPRGTSQKLVADQCCSCLVVGLESQGHVEISVFVSKSVDVLCQGTVVHSLWYPNDTVLKLKLLPLDARQPELYVEEKLAVGFALVVATLARGLVVYCIGLRATPGKDRFRTANIVELPCDLSTTFDGFRIRDLTVTLSEVDGLIVTSSSVPVSSFSSSSHRVLMTYFSLPDIIAMLFDQEGNGPATASDTRTAVIMENIGAVREMVLRREGRAKYMLAILTSTELFCLVVTVHPSFSVGSLITLSVHKFHPTEQLGPAVALIECQHMTKEVKFCALYKQRRTKTVIQSGVDHLTLAQTVSQTLSELQMPLSGLESHLNQEQTKDLQLLERRNVVDLVGKLGRDNNKSALTHLKQLTMECEESQLKVRVTDHLAHLVFIVLREVRGVLTLDTIATRLPTAVSDFDSIQIKEIAVLGNSNTGVSMNESQGDSQSFFSPFSPPVANVGRTRFRFCHLNHNSNRLFISSVLVTQDLLSTQLESMETIDTFNNLHDKPSGGKVRSFAMVGDSNDALRAIISRKSSPDTATTPRAPMNVSLHAPCKLVIAYFKRVPKTGAGNKSSIVSLESDVVKPFTAELSVADDNYGGQLTCTTHVASLVTTGITSQGPTHSCLDEIRSVSAKCMLCDGKGQNYANNRTDVIEMPQIAPTAHLSIEEKMDFMLLSMTRFQASVLERMDNLESAIRVSTERIKALEDTFSSHEKPKTNGDVTSWLSDMTMWNNEY